MNQDAHPDYHFITVVMTDGTSYQTRSTYGKEGATLNLDIDPKTHPAWTGGNQTLLDRSVRLYERIRHLDRRMYLEAAGEAEAPSPVLAQHDRLKMAFGG